VRTTEHIVKPASAPEAGHVAMLWSLLPAGGNGAPSSSALVRPLHRGQCWRTALLAIAVSALWILASAAPALAEGECSTCKPWWHLLSRIQPASIAPGAEGTVVVQAVDVGDEGTTGASTLSDVLPAGLSVVEDEGVQQIKFYLFAFGHGKEFSDLGPGSFKPIVQEAHLCGVTGQRVTCSTAFRAFAEKRRAENEEREAKGEEPLQEFPESLLGLEHLNPYEDIEMRIRVKADPSAVSAANATEVSGGGAPSVSATRTLPIASGAPPFGAEDFRLVPEEAGGGVDTHAGSHPFQLTTTLTLNQTDDPLRPPALPRNLRFNLPPGLIGNAAALPQCSDSDFRHVAQGGAADLCPPDTAVGVSAITIDEPEFLGLLTIPVPLFNLVPEYGEPARFGFEVYGTPVTIDTSVRTGSDYGVTVSVSNITELATFLSSTVTFWGVPGDRIHDASRGWGCLAGGIYGGESEQPCNATSLSSPPPFLTLPTSCAGAFEPSVEGLSWANKANPEGAPFAAVPYNLKDSLGRALAITACNQLAFSPSIEIKPDVQSASSPTGLSARVHVPQEVNENSKGLASSNLKDIAVTLPEGVGLNPASADGLQACSEAQIGFLGALGGSLRFTPRLPSPFCPDASKIATAKITTPLLAEPLEGSVYLASQNANPFGSLVAIYIVAEDPVAGVLVTLPGEVSLDQQSGRVTTRINGNPPLPFEDAELHFFGGARAPLSTPSHCGSYATEATFTPWSGNPPVHSSSSFAITSGPNGSPCPGTLPFAPSLAAGTTNIQAGAFTPLSTTITREDGNQDIQAVKLTLPPGFSGIISSLTPCPEAQASAGSCGPESLIGHTIVSVGLGGQPFSVTGGQVFLTAPYKGAPFGLSIVNPAKAGPFDLGKVIVRAKLEIDRSTAQAIVSTDPEGPYAIPHILDGIPLQIKHVNVTIDRPGFAFNPTNCNPLQISGQIQSDEGQSAAVSVPFQVTNCATLKFTPKFTVSTNGKTSKQQGASLTAKLSYPKGPQGAQSNIARVKVSLPKQLPSRLTTLQKACLFAVFEKDPAACPPESVIGHARVLTPLLPLPLSGPAYFVSHGGEAFPSLTLILQGDNVTIELVGSTLIRGGITTTTFKSTPDTPFSNFELTLPQGRFSALAANGNLCKGKLLMPTELVAQNGAVIKQSTKISVGGCAKHRKHGKHGKHGKRKKGGKRGG
jgi:hypothetical protein